MKFDVSTWYETDVSLTLALMESFARVVEQLAKESIPLYEKYKETYSHEDEEVQHYQGLDSLTVDLKKTFEEYFPSLRRRSAFLNVWGTFESELNKLCERYKREKGLSLSVSELRGGGIERATDYLEKVAGLRFVKPEWERITKMRNLRNVIAHRDGSLKDLSDGQVKAAIQYIEETDTLTTLYNEVAVKEGFLAQVLATIRTYFQSIGAATN